MTKLKNCSNCGKLMVMIGVLIAVPLLIFPFYPEEKMYFSSFAVPSLFSVTAGILLCLFVRRDADEAPDRQDEQEQSSLIVLFVWFWGIIVGCMPFLISGQLTFIQAFFESVSGWTTTGLSTMDVTQTPKVFLFYRSFMQYCGGLGFIMMMVMLVSEKQSMDLFSAEGHPDKLMPNLKKTAQIIFEMYSAFLVAGTAAYAAFGMPLLESVCHAMCSLSTGGFSTRLFSIGEYNSLPIEIVTIILMLIGTTNFAVLLLLLKRKWRRAFEVSEIRFLLVLLVIFIPVTTFSVAKSLDIGILESLRQSVFNITSALSTTGYSTVDYAKWPPFAVGVMILMMLIGGGAGSTAGGMKLSRVYLMLRMVGMNIKKRFLPERNVEAPYYVKPQGKTKIDSALCSDTLGFVGCYMLLFVAGSLLLTLTSGCGLTESMFEFASALGTVGLSIGLTGPATGAATLVVEIFGMILGRLEIFIVLAGLRFTLRAFKKTRE